MAPNTSRIRGHEHPPILSGGVTVFLLKPQSGGGGEITVRTRTLTSSVFIVVTEVCVDGPAELQDVIPLVLIHPLVLGLLWKDDWKMSLGGGVKGFLQTCRIKIQTSNNQNVSSSRA